MRNARNPWSSASARAWVGTVLLVLTATLAGCRSTVDIAELATSSGDAGSPQRAQPVAERLSVHLVADSRTLEERGSRRVGGRSFLGTGQLQEPLEVALLKVLAHEALQRGLAKTTVFRRDPDAHICEVTIRSLHASWTEGVENLTVVLPTSRVRAVAEIEVQWKDAVGRVLARARAKANEEDLASALGEPEVTAARSMARVLAGAARQIMDQIETVLDGARPGEASPVRRRPR